MADLDYLVLELGNPLDSIALISGLHARGGFNNVTPDDKIFTNNLEFKPEYLSLEPKEWFPGFDKFPAPDDWLKQWCLKKPWLVYLSGHYDGLLYNSKEPTNFSASFGTKGTLAIKANAADKTFSCSSLDTGCSVVIVVGCSILSEADWRNEMQTFLESASGKPTILGFYKKCPTEKQNLLVKYFVEGLPATGTPTESEMCAAWFAAAKKWKADSPSYAGNVGYMTSGAKVFVPDANFAPVEGS